MASQETAGRMQFDAPIHPFRVKDSSPEVPRVLWQPGKEFSPQSVTDILRQKPRSIDGRLVWVLSTDTGSPTCFDLFPVECRLARVLVAGRSNRPITWEIDSIDSIEGSVHDGVGAVTLRSDLGWGSRTLTVFATGRVVDELSVDNYPRQGLSDSDEEVVWVPESTPNQHPLESLQRDLTVNEAARIMGCSPGNVRSLISHGKLRADFRGRQWFVDPAAAMSFRRSPRGRPRQ